MSPPPPAVATARRLARRCLGAAARARVGVVLGLVASAGACVRAPDVFVVDRRTALEAEAAGRFADLEARLERDALAPEPMPLSRAALERAGLRAAAPEDAISRFSAALRTDADRCDVLLQRRCVGEGHDGLLRATPKPCQGAVDDAEVVQLVERHNRARQQLWAWLERKAPQAAPATLRAAWRQRQLERVICGGWVEMQPGEWREKACP